MWITTIGDACGYYENEAPRGEYVLVIAGKDRAEIELEQQKSWEAMSLEEHVALYEAKGHERKEAMRLAAKDRGISKRDVYQQLLSIKNKEEEYV